jgi:galactokinase
MGLEILVDGQVPLGAGLSSSAALECATAVGLNSLFALDLDLPELARAAQRAENDYVGMPCGIMDQSISLMAKSGHALLLDCVDLSSEQIPLDFLTSQLQLLIIDTNVHHALVDGGYAERRRTCEAALRQIGFRSMRDLDLSQLELFGNSLDEISYKRVRHAVTEIDRVHRCVEALSAGNFEEVGRLLVQSHQSLRDDYEVSAPELNLAVDLAVANKALGARMVGGGFGGSAIALVKIDALETIKAAIESGFAKAEFQPPRFFVTTPSDGAKVELIN